jgi:hypothetical protein
MKDVREQVTFYVRHLGKRVTPPMNTETEAREWIRQQPGSEYTLEERALIVKYG